MYWEHKKLQANRPVLMFSDKKTHVHLYFLYLVPTPPLHHICIVDSSIVMDTVVLS